MRSGYWLAAVLVVVVDVAPAMAQKQQERVNPCHLVADVGRPDFAYNQQATNDSAFASSDDGRLLVRRRLGSDNTLRLRLLEVRVAPINQGTRGYRSFDKCVSRLRLTMNEGPGVYQSGPHSEEALMPSPLDPGRSSGVRFEVTLVGTGTDRVEEGWNKQLYDYVVLDVELDQGNVILEDNELNNDTPSYCYHPASHSFVSMKLCGGAP